MFVSPKATKIFPYIVFLHLYLFDLSHLELLFLFVYDVR